MNIFNDNKLLEERIFYSLDWGCYLRSNLNNKIEPTILLFNDEKRVKIIGFPEEEDNYIRAIEILKKSQENFTQFYVIYEAQMMSDKKEVIDTIIVKGFDRRQKNGVFIFQQFKIEKNKFITVNNPAILGNISMEIEEINEQIPNIEQIPINIIKATNKENNKTDIIGLIRQTNVSVISYSIKNFIESYLKVFDKENLSGKFKIDISYLENDVDLLKYLLKKIFNEIVASDFCMKNFIYKGINISLVVTCKDETLFSDNTKELANEISGLLSVMQNVSNENNSQKQVKMEKKKKKTKKWWEFWK